MIQLSLHRIQVRGVNLLDLKVASQLTMASSASLTVQSKGIYHGLPVFPESLKGLSAIVTGANGISGDHMVRVLAESPERWSNIYTLSRRPPAIQRQWGDVNVQHVSLDFLVEPEDMASVLRKEGVKA